ncbi:MAG: C69 family dipeptidase [Promethearchaeia archaeon]
MCDTLVALGNSTEDGSVIFGKNSDRPNSEAQLITYIPRKRHKETEVKTTYISIPQVKETAAVILSQPWWMWGAEMGCSDNGVVIGNEAVSSYESVRSEGLLGMDLLRLGLERAKNARHAVEVISELLEKYHQGGACAYQDASWKYHNSFLIADAKEAWVLETADDWWVAEQVKDIRSISNGLTIRGKGEIRREGIIQYAIEEGYCKDDDDFDFAVTFSGAIPSTSPYTRGGKSKRLLKKNKGEITPRKMMKFLQEHEAGICMHGSFESVGSQVSHLMDDMFQINWFTGTTLPCQSIYKPYTFSIDDQYYLEPGPYDEINKDWIWVKHALKARNGNLDTTNKNSSFQDQLLNKINKFIEKRETLSNKEFREKVWTYNKKAWKHSRARIFDGD